MTTELRTSQVEVLRYIGEGLIGRNTTECAARFGSLWTEMGRDLQALEDTGHLSRRKARFYLTQLGHEALEGSDG